MQNFKLVGYVDTPAVPTGFLIPAYQCRGISAFFQAETYGRHHHIRRFAFLNAQDIAPAQIVLFKEEVGDLRTDIEDKPFHVYRNGDDILVGKADDADFKEGLKQIRANMKWRAVEKENINRFLKCGR